MSCSIMIVPMLESRYMIELRNSGDRVRHSTCTPRLNRRHRRDQAGAPAVGVLARWDANAPCVSGRIGEIRGNAIGIAWCRAHTDPWRGWCALPNGWARRTAGADEIFLIHHVFNMTSGSGQPVPRVPRGSSFATTHPWIARKGKIARLNGTVRMV
jgi:hypothetical protein